MRTLAPRWLFAALICLLTVAVVACSDDDPVDTTSGADAETTTTTMAPDEDMDTADGGHADGEHADEHEMTDGEMTDGEMTDGEMTDGAAHDDGHDELVEVDGDVVPTVDVEVFDDPSGGVNVHVTSTDFTVNPEAASTDHVDGEGHYHLYVDGEKTQRFYNDWIHVPGVVEGEVEIAVSLNANDHRAYAVDGEPIVGRVDHLVAAHSHDEHSHDDEVPVEWEGEAPTIEVEMVEDPKSGWNAFIVVDGITLSPEHVSTDHVPGEGHLHIFANGQKIGRLYGTATHVEVLPAGDVEISVAAYTNDHQPYVVDGAPVAGSTTVTVDDAS